MKTKKPEEIKKTVRQTYGRIALEGAAGAAEGQRESSACQSLEQDPGQASAGLGYSDREISSVLPGANLGLGCGNPVAIGSLNPGETVVDLGSGGGFDCFLAAGQVSEKGRVIGVDMTPDMISLARENALKMETPNVEFRLGEIEHLPLADGSADVAMSNCVINLSPDKQAIYDEMFRVLRPGGRVAISDVLALAPLSEEVRRELARGSACSGGAATIDQTGKMLELAGFEDIRIKPKETSREIIEDWEAGPQIAGYVVAAYIQAVKPG